MNMKQVRKETLSRLLYSMVVSGLALLGACNTSGGDSPSFTLAITPQTVVAAQGSRAQLTVTVNRTEGFTGEVMLELLDPPAGISASSVTVPEGSTSGTMTVSLSSEAAVTSHTLAVQGRSGNLTAQALFALTVTESGRAPSSFDLIEDAFKQGMINYETAISYKALAVFGDERLPEEYRGYDTGLDGTSAMTELVINFEQLPQETQEMLQPFLLTPTEPGSWYERVMEQQGELETAAIQWGTVNGKTAKVKVWWDNGNFPQDRTKAQQIVDALDSTIWPKLTGLMKEPLPDCGASCARGGGDTRLDIYLVFMGSDLDGLTTGFGTVPTPDFVTIKRTLPSGAELLSVVAHEFMHTIQDAYPAASFDEYDWLYEATATWAEDYVYPNVDREHGFASSFLSTPETPLEDREGVHEYGAYLFFLYLRGKLGQPELLKSIWENASNANSLAAINSVIPGGFAAHWHEFARLNYNKPPITDYQTRDNLHEAATVKNVPVTDAAVRPLSTNAKHLSALYWNLAFTNSEIRSISFDNPYAAGGWPTAKIQAIVKIAGQEPRVEDWTATAKKKFCRDRAEENVESIVLIISNSEWQNRGHELGGGTIDVTTKEECFVIEKIEGPAALVFDGPPGDYSLTWKGNPTFPVTLVAKIISCGIDVCSDAEKIYDIEANPLTFRYYCYTVGSGDKPPTPGSITHEITLRDSEGLETPPFPFTVACQNGGSFSPLPMGGELSTSGGRLE